MRHAHWIPEMTEPEDSMSSDQAVERAWEKLRRKLAHKMENPEAQKWREISDQNRFGPSFFAMLRELEQQ